MSWQEITDKFNLAVNVIDIINLKSNNRIDPQYYGRVYLEYEKMIERKGFKTIADFAFITDGIHASIDFDENSGINLISAMSPKENYFDLSGNGYIGAKQNAANPRTILKQDDVIVSTVGTIGNCAVVDEEILPANSDRHVGIIRIKDTFRPRFISTFLLSKYGRFQTMREATGNVQLNLFIDKIRTIKIPIASNSLQDKIESAILLALKIRKKSRNIYKEAEQILLQELGLTDHKPDESNISVRELNECLRDNRFDAEYWQIKYDELLAKINKYQTKRLGEIVTRKKGVEVGSEEYAEEGLPFIRVSDFSIDGISEAEKRISQELFDALKANYSPKKGEILFTKDGTIGISYALDEDLNAIISGAFLRLKPKAKINNEYLALVLNSMICKMQIERMAGGAIIAHLKPDNALNLVIPILSDEKQALIEEKAKQAKKLKRQSKELLEKTKRAVEIFIEKDESAAIEYLNQ